MSERDSKPSRAQLGISDGMLRLSVGLEAFDDLAADIEAALVVSGTCHQHGARKGRLGALRD